jgi:MoaA/NifB/PqqE/SkfB family radical SAM enzyme
MTPEEKLTLTPEQEKAFKSFERAYKKCKKSGIQFYTVLSTITAFNGEYIDDIHDDQSKKDFCLNVIDDFNSHLIDDVDFSGWADDDHFVSFK